MDSDLNITLGKKLRFFRTRAGVSQQEIENEIGLSSGTLSRIENGETNPTKETLFKIIKLLKLGKLETEYLIGKLQSSATKDEIESVRAQVKDYFSDPKVLAYILDDRFRLIDFSEGFSRVTGVSQSRKYEYLEIPFIKIVTDEKYPVRKLLDDASFETTLFNIFVRAFVEIGFMVDDPVVRETLDYIKSNDTYYSIWKKVEKLNPNMSYFSDIESRKVIFNFYGIKIALYFDNEILFGNDRFYLIQYHPTNKLLKQILKLF